MMSRRAVFTALMCALLCVPLVSAPLFTHAQSKEEIQQQIDDNNAQIAQLNKEIAQYQTQLDSTQQQRNTLQNKINQLNLQNKQLSAKVNVTRSQIKTTQLQITDLADGISQKEASIGDEQDGLAESIRILNEVDQVPLAVTLIGANTITDAWEDSAALATIQGAVHDSILKLAADRQALAASKNQAEQKKTQLVTQQKTLTTQQGSLAAITKSQSQLLSETKNKEANYQKIIAEKQAQEKSFEDTINQLQAKLKAADTTTVPSAGTSVLSWPLDSVHITQYFGNTEFARTAAYNGKGHNGIDLRASIGTPVHAALTGVVEDTNLGVAPLCQYGKWVLVKHANGLSTLYAHLSSIQVSKGETVSTGDLLGYSGDTGYATGPHLHFTVYNSSGVSFINYKCASGPTVRVPVSPFNGYLNPMDYLPEL